MSSRAISTRSSRPSPRQNRPSSSSGLAAEAARPVASMLGTATARTRRAILCAAREVLSAAGIDTAAADAEWLLAGTLGTSRAALHLDGRLPAGVAARYDRAVSRRARREPLQRILGWEEFHGLRFCLTDAVLVPRPETEILAEWACVLLPRAEPDRDLTAIDVGPGSGCVAFALARHRPDLRVIALDVAPEAAAVARANAGALGAGARVSAVAGDLLAAVRPRVADLVVANLPYLPTAMIASLAPEVRDHDPRLALNGGPDGLRIIRRLVREAPSRLAAGGTLVLETAGPAQVRAVSDLLNEAGFRRVLVHNDLTGVERFAAGSDHLARGGG